MFINVQRIEEGSFAADHLQNPVNPNNLMVLGIYRNYIGTAFTKGYSKKAAPIYWDTVTGKTISRRKWTSDMISYANKCLGEVRPAPYKFKLTVIGYIFLLGIIGLFGYLIYDSVKPSVNSSAAVPSSLEEKIEGGDLYYGRFIEKDPATKIGKRAGYGWFKVMDAGAESLLVSMSTEMSSTHKPSNEMNSTSFEKESIPMEIKTKESYQIDLISKDGSYEITFSEKK